MSDDGIDPADGDSSPFTNPGWKKIVPVAIVLGLLLLALALYVQPRSDGPRLDGPQAPEGQSPP